MSVTGTTSEVTKTGFVLQCRQSGKFLEDRTTYPNICNLVRNIDEAEIFESKEGTVKYCLGAGSMEHGYALPIITDMIPVEVERVLIKTTKESYITRRKSLRSNQEVLKAIGLIAKPFPGTLFGSV